MRFDAETAGWITRLSGDLAERQGRTRPVGSYPHATLVPTDAADEARRIDAFRALSLETRRILLRLSHVGVFPGAGVVYLGITMTRRLLDLHRDVLEALAPTADTPWLDLYGPDSWVPHCTLGVNLSAGMLGEAVEWLSAQASLPMDASVAAIDFVRVNKNALRVVQSFSLAVASDCGTAD